MAMTKMSLIACCVMMGCGLAACDANAVSQGIGSNDPAVSRTMIYGEQPKGDQGVSSRCAAIVNPAERRRCIQSGG
jgi:hypothetical protein